MKIDEMLVTTTKNNPSLSYSQLDWIYYHIFFFFDLGKEIEKDNFFHLVTAVRQKEYSKVSVAQW